MNRIKLAVSKDATVTGAPTGTDVPTVDGNTSLKAIAKAAIAEFEAHRKAERIHPIVFPAPHFPQLFTPTTAPPPAPVPRPPLDPAEAAAWRHVVFVLSKTASPTKRKIMAERVSDFTQGRCPGELGLELPDVATLFHPNSPKDAATVLAALQQACEAGTLPSYGQVLFISQLAAWPDIPAAATDSPLRFWLPFLPNAAAAPEAGQTTEDEWTPQRLRDELQRLKADGGKAPMQRLVKLSGIKEREIRRKVEALGKAEKSPFHGLVSMAAGRR